MHSFAIQNLALKMNRLQFFSVVRFCFKRSQSTITNKQARQMRSEMFTKEKLRQQALITRVEKIDVRYLGPPEQTTLMMNKNLSTPYNCAMHVHEVFCQRSLVAEVNGELWDIHRPLTESCDLRFLNYCNSPAPLNKVFWRSCSFLLGLVIEEAFKDDYFIKLHSWPKPDIRSGSYVYDVDIGIPDWEPTSEELNTLTTILWKLAAEDNHFERLDVSESLALEMFQHNPFKLHQIPKIISQSPNQTVTLYQVKDHIDISCGPMVGSTKCVGMSKVTSVHHLDRLCGYRFQAVSIPKQETISAFAFSILTERAKKLNPNGLKIDDEDVKLKEQEVKSIEETL